MISSEKDLEDYICDNQEEFIEELKKIFGLKKEKEIIFVGRQVSIGKDNRADLVYCFEDKIIDENTNEIFINNLNYIIVELKFRKLELEDLGQICRYMSVLKDKINSEEERDKDFRYCDVFGVFVSFGLNNTFQEFDVAKITEKIGYLKIEAKLEYCKEDYSRNESYINDIKLDSKIENLYGGKDESRND